MRTPQEELLLQISLCRNRIKNETCSKIVHNQKCNPLHLPEPWSGDLKNAKILFLGSNPSYNCHEDYPTADTNPDEIIDFFLNRFSKYSTKELYPKMKKGYEKEKKWVRFWAGVRARANELSPDKTLVLGRDIVISELVHCKSKSEKGVKEAADARAQACYEPSKLINYLHIEALRVD